MTQTQLADARWYAAYTAPCREKRVAEHLAMRRIESFLPIYRSRRKWRNGCRVQLERPLFPGYVFVRMGGTERVRVLEVPGVLWLVGQGRQPEPLEDGVIDTLRTSIQLKEVEPHSYLVVGERVRISAGPFAGLSGIVLREKSRPRVVLSVDQIMQSISVEVDIDDLEPIHAGLPARRNLASQSPHKLYDTADQHGESRATHSGGRHHPFCATRV